MVRKGQPANVTLNTKEWLQSSHTLATNLLKSLDQDFWESTSLEHLVAWFEGPGMWSKYRRLDIQEIIVVQVFFTSLLMPPGLNIGDRVTYASSWQRQLSICQLLSKTEMSVSGLEPHQSLQYTIV